MTVMQTSWEAQACAVNQMSPHPAVITESIAHASAYQNKSAEIFGLIEGRALN
jgi:hypothetical protein